MDKRAWNGVFYPMFFLPLLAGIPSFREEVCLASSQQRSFQRDGWTSLEFTWFFSMAISTTQCCQSPTVKTPSMDESAKITEDKIRRASHQVFSYMDDTYKYIYIYTHPGEMFSFATPSPICPLSAFFFSSGCLWMTCSTPSSAISRQVVHFPPETKVIPFVGWWDTSGDPGDLLKKITSIPMRRNTENLQMMGI